MAQLTTEPRTIEHKPLCELAAKELNSQARCDEHNEKKLTRKDFWRQWRCALSRPRPLREGGRTLKNPGWSSKLCAFAAIGIVVLTCEMAHGQNGESALIPPQSNFRGLSFEEWNVRWSEWQIGTGLGEQTDLPDTIRGVRFLPGAFAPGEYEFDVCVRPGTAFVFPGFFVFGERYDDPNVPDDDPDNPILDLIFETTFIEIRLDGRVIRAGLASELDQFGPEFFADPIVYAEPQPRGPDLNSVAALFVLGPGAVFRPMSAGEHLLETNVNSLFFGEFNYAHNIHVTPRGR